MGVVPLVAIPLMAISLMTTLLANTGLLKLASRKARKKESLLF
jgi:hypothetical protein